MFFTQDDYKKIQQWLIKNSVKDTEFNEANIPFNGEETITIVQGNQNKKVFLKDLIAQVFNLGISDFVNITDKYNAPNISLEEAIRLIPSRARKEGQVITFLDREDHWHIYQFKGVLNQWNVLDTWEDLFDWENLIIDSILPDEEDLTKSPADENSNSYLSLKNREYNPEDFSGLGRIILRKNIVEVEDPIYGKIKNNILYQDMFTQSNTIYEIRYDFDLNGKEITIPEGCVLDFQGGSLNNGKILFNNTFISNNANINCIVRGRIKNTDVYLSWFEGKIYNISSSDIDKNYNLDLSNKILYFDSKIIEFSKLSIIDTNNCIIDGLNNEIIIGDSYFIFYLGVCKNIEVKNFKVQGNTNSIFFGGYPRSSDKESSLNFHIHHNIINTCSLGISLNADGGRPPIMYATVEYNRIIMNNPSSDIGTYGIHLANANNCLIDNNYITGANRHAIYNAYGNYNTFSNNILEKNKEFSTSDNAVVHILRRSQHIKILNNTFINNGGACLNISKSKFSEAVDYDGILYDVLIEGNKFYQNNNDYATYFISVGTTENITDENSTTKDVIIKNNVFNHNNTKSPKGIVVYKVENLAVESNYFNWIYSERFELESTSTFFYFAVADKDTIKNTVITNNTYYANNKIGGWVYMSKSSDLPSSIIIQNNKYLNHRGVDSFNYRPTYIDTTGKINIESFNIVTYKYSDDKDKVINTGHYNVAGDIIYTHSLYPNSSNKKPNLGYQCLEDGNPGVWMPFGGLSNIPDFGSSGLPKGFLGRYHMLDHSPLFCNNEGDWVRADSYPYAYTRVGNIEDIPVIEKFRFEAPFNYLDITNKRPLWYCLGKWIDGVGDDKDYKKYGTFSEKPSAPRKGFQYFCTDRQTTEGTTNGIMIYHKGNDVWVDALGRVVE